MPYRYPHVLYPNNELTELLEMYEKLVNEYNSILASVTAIDTKVTELYSYVDEEIRAGLASTIDEVNVKIGLVNTRITEVERAMFELELETSNRFTVERAITNNALEVTESTLMLEIRELEKAVAEDIAEIWQYIKEIEQTGFKVFNPTTAESSTVERAINDVWQRARLKDTFSAKEFDASAITCEEFDGKVTCAEFDTYGKVVLLPPMIYNTFTGLKEPVANVIQSQKFYDTTDAITCGEFDALPITCAEFDALTITAFEFDTKANAIL